MIFKRTIITLLATTMVASPLMNAAHAYDPYYDDYRAVDEWELEEYYQQRRLQEKRAARQQAKQNRHRQEKRVARLRAEEKARKAANRRQHKRQKKKDRNAAVAIGILGLIAGAAIIGSMNNNQRPRIQHNLNQQPYGTNRGRNPRVVYSTQLQPWTQEWYNHCRTKYRSFNPETGNFFGYDGKYHFCK